MNIKSFQLFLINVLMAGISYFVLTNNLAKQDGLLRFVIIPILIYTSMSFVPAIIGFFIGIRELKEGLSSKLCFLGVIGNGLYAIVAIVFIVKIWPQLMGI